jgi:hypothetical protein
MEYSSDALAQAAYVTNGTFRSNADIVDEDMSDITDWTDGDIGGDSSQVTFDSQSCMQLDSGINVAIRTQDLGTFGDRTVISLNLYCDVIGTLASVDVFRLTVHNGSIKLFATFATDGLYIYNGSSNVEAGTDLVVADTWQEWTFDVDWVAKTVDVYLAGVLKSSGMSIDYASATANGTVELRTVSGSGNNRISYVDWFMGGSDLGTKFLQSYSESTIKTQGSYALKVVAAQTDSLNKTLTKTFVVNQDLTGVNTLKLDMRASRTGANIKLGLHDTGGMTTELTPTIVQADTYQTVTWDISGVSDANKDAIDTFIITVLNADSANTVYFDNFNIAQGFSGFFIS